MMGCRRDPKTAHSLNMTSESPQFLIATPSVSSPHPHKPSHTVKFFGMDRRRLFFKTRSNWFNDPSNSTLFLFKIASEGKRKPPEPSHLQWQTSRLTHCLDGHAAGNPAFICGVHFRVSVHVSTNDTVTDLFTSIFEKVVWLSSSFSV